MFHTPHRRKGAPILGARWPRTRGPFGYRPGADDREEFEQAAAGFDPKTFNAPPIDLTEQHQHHRQAADAQARREAAYYEELERILAMPEAERQQYPAWMVREALQLAARRREQDRPRPAPPAAAPAPAAPSPLVLAHWRQRYHLDR